METFDLNDNHEADVVAYLLCHDAADVKNHHRNRVLIESDRIEEAKEEVKRVNELASRKTMTVHTTYFTTVESEWEIPKPEDEDWDEMTEQEKRDYFFRHVRDEPEEQRVFYDAQNLEEVH
jgi:hypothetical protein